MWRNWWRRASRLTKTTHVYRGTVAEDERIEIEPAFAIPIDCKEDVKSGGRNEWSMPFLGSDEALNSVLLTSDDIRPANALPFFAFDEAGLQETFPWHSDSWWLQTEPKSQHFVTERIEEWMPTALGEEFAVTAFVADNAPRYIDRIALLQSLSGVFDFAEFVGTRR